MFVCLFVRFRKEYGIRLTDRIFRLVIIGGNFHVQINNFIHIQLRVHLRLVKSIHLTFYVNSVKIMYFIFFEKWKEYIT